MKFRLSLQLLLGLLVVGAAFSLDITTRDGKTYKHAKVTSVYSDGLSITHSTGVVKIPFDNLPDAIQKDYNYDPGKAAADRKAAEDAAQAAAAQAATAQREREQAALRAKQDARRQADEPIAQLHAPVAAPDFSPLFAILLVIAILVAAIAAIVAVARAKQRSERKALLLKEYHEFAANVQQSCALPTMPTNIILKPDERAFYSTRSILYETRAVRQYQAAHSGVRVAKGVYIGGTSGRSISSQQWSKLDTGLLTITNKRLVFVGGREDRTVPLNKVVSVNANLSQIVLSVEGRQKAMVFDVPNPLIASAIIRLSPHAKDASKLSGDNLALDVKE